jgi:hypothetical protein
MFEPKVPVISAYKGNARSAGGPRGGGPTRKWPPTISA